METGRGRCKSIGKQTEGVEKLKARKEGSWKRGRESRAREGGGAWKPPKLGYLTPHTSRPSGQLTAISSMR